jgi:predicted DNA-binding transcriptional regulator AlpA
MTEKLLTTEQVLDRVPFGRTWLDERVAAGEFPKPVHKWRRNLWLESKVDRWIIENFGDHQASPPISATARVSH